MYRTILLIQAAPKDATLVRQALAALRDPAVKVEWVKTCALGIQRLDLQRARQDSNEAAAFDAVLCDLDLPDTAGIEAFKLIFSALPRIPILILSAPSEEAVAHTAVLLGAHDYILKGRVDTHTLPKLLLDTLARSALVERLRDQKERAQRTLDSIGDAVISTDMAGRITYVNAMAERLTGWTSGAAIDLPLHEVFQLVDEETRLAVPSPLSRTTGVDRGRALPRANVLIRRDGVATAIEDSVAPIYDASGRATGTVTIFHDVTHARALTRELAYLAHHDPLTDLPNRALLHDRLTQALSWAERHQTVLALIYLDLDHFKQINDSLGHLIGDRLLQSVALRLSQCVRSTDTISRQGGDEFVILLPSILHAQDAAACAEKIIQAVKLPYLLEENELHVTASIGIAIYPDDGMGPEALLQNVDSAMYEAKANGRNTYRFYRSDVNAKAIERQALESAMRHALQRGQFELYYQPVVNLVSSEIVGVEALIRWHHPALGFVLPGQFIAIAEESGLIVPMGQWVLRCACLQVKAWQNLGFTQLRLAVNTSAVELRSKSFLSMVKTILEECAFNPRLLDLELTETYLMQDSKSTAAVLTSLRELGIHLILDDFGTGYSSLSYMRRFPIGGLKVDKSFVSNIGSDADDASVVSAVVHMGSSLHMRVVAEGVETQEQFAFLREQGCVEAQGYYFHRPLDAAALLGVLHAHAPFSDLSGMSRTSGEPPIAPDASPPESRERPAPPLHPVPVNERERLEELYRVHILDTAPDAFFDRLTQLAADACDTPIALISLIDSDRQWFKSRVGMTGMQTAREQAFCAHTILGTQPLVVENAAVDPRFADNVFVLGEPGIRFYAAVPLVTSRGFAIGSLCVIDRQPRHLPAEKIRTLQMLATQAVQQMELTEVAESMRKHSLLLERVQSAAKIGGWEVDIQTDVMSWTRETYRIFGWQPQDIPSVASVLAACTTETRAVLNDALANVLGESKPFEVEFQISTKGHSRRWVRATGCKEEVRGYARRLCGTFQDISDLHQLRQEMVVVAQRELMSIGAAVREGLGQELTEIFLIVSKLLTRVPTTGGSLHAQVEQVESLIRSAISICQGVAGREVRPRSH